MKFLIKLFGRNFLVREKIEGIGKELPRGVDINDYYTMNVICNNCNNRTNIYVKKGIHLNDIITSVRCNNCECRLEKEK